MIHFKDPEQMKDVTPADLSKAEAKRLTQKIKAAVDDLWALLIQAHKGKAWKALGYSTWEAYVNAEFSMSRQRSYQLIDQGNVIHAIAEATGENVKRVGQISARDAAAVKDDLSAVTEDIKARVGAGQDLGEAVAETVAAKREERKVREPQDAREVKERQRQRRQAEQAENDRIREEHAAALPQAIKDRERAKADAVAARKTKPADVDALIAENEELREANAALEAEVAVLKADNAKWEAMRVQFEQGGFEKVIAGKDEEIRVLLTRVETESREKVSNLRAADRWQKRAIDLGYTDREVIEING